MEHLTQYHINMPLTQLNYPIIHQTVNWTGELPFFVEAYTIYSTMNICSWEVFECQCFSPVLKWQICIQALQSIWLGVPPSVYIL